jgi:4,5-dihydroxyphthalate decarboxylase
MNAAAPAARLEVVGANHDHTLGMSQTRRGVEIRYRTADLMPVFEKMIAERGFEACEFSLANYVMLKDRGADWLSAIPVFPARAFRHANIYVRADSPLQGPSQLRGRRIGVPEYSMTLAVWMRGILAEQFGVHWSEMRWTTTGKQRFSTLEGVEVDVTNADLEEALLAGHLDVLLAPRTRDEARPAAQRQLRRLIADPQAAQDAYLRDTGIHPINHVVVLREDILARLPDAPQALYEAFCACKAASYGRRNVKGDPLPYGMTAANRSTVAKLCSFLHDQKLIRRVPELEGLFLPIDENKAIHEPA